MALLTSHLLNTVDGTHAGHVNISIIRIDPTGARDHMISSATDEGGRLRAEIPLTDADTVCDFEMGIDVAPYFAARGQADAVTVAGGTQIISQLVIRFRMPDIDGQYHIPLMIGPNIYSVWWSS